MVTPTMQNYYFGGVKMAELHFKEYPYKRNLFNIEVSEIKGNKFKDWQKKADYSIRTTIILQIDTTNVSTFEKQVAPNITFISTNQAIVNIYNYHALRGLSYDEFNSQYAKYEFGIEKQVHELLYNLNAARQRAGLMGQWFINYGLNERHVEVSRS